jgi:hypothetical protein
LGDLPYQRSGSTNVTLTSLGAPLYVITNTTFTPFYETIPFMAAVAVALVVMAYVAARVSRKRRKLTPAK